MSDPTPDELSLNIKHAAHSLGFDLVGITPAATPPGYPNFLAWLDAGYAGEMSYLERRKEAYAHPRGVLPSVNSVIMLGLNYDSQAAQQRRTGQPKQKTGQGGNAASSPSNPRVAAYALSPSDYHDVIRKRLKQLTRTIRALQPESYARGVVDTAPLLERDFARLAGLGWFGKNTMLINKWRGSFFFLAGILTDLELTYDDPHISSHCGTCTRCLDACPTDAFPEPGVLNASRCISYLTIELKDAIPTELRKSIGEWLFGCDICQDVCPWNRKSLPTSQSDLQPIPILTHPNPRAMLAYDESQFHEVLGATPLARPQRRGIRRNAAIVLGNVGTSADIPTLQATANDPDPIIRDAAQWAIHQIKQRSSEQTQSPENN